MRLKSLEIQGFKSFQDKTVVHFNDCITGIVGPNGCGKSNIVDAMRWVMGEQSAKHLRGQHMEDIIFSGSQARQPGSMASVELTFSTVGAQTPPQYAGSDEISIGRKLFRTGESEYYINRQSVRLKDIVDLFLGTGVGTKAYSIIEQGRVGQIITAKPEERRYYIEEAAGISKFKARKEAALRKMEATQQNLLRLKDILAEIERQTASLDRQAKKAQKYKIVRDELMGLELTIAASDFVRWQAEQEESLTRIKDNDSRELEMRNQVIEAENWIEQERIEIVALEQAVMNSQQENYDLDNRLRLAESRLQAKRDEIFRIERDANQNAASLKELTEECEGVRNGFAQVESSKVLADLDCEELEDVVFREEVEYNRLQESSHSLFAVIESARDTANGATSRLAQIVTQSQNVRERLQEAASKKSVGEDELETLSRKAQEVTKQINSLGDDLNEVRQLRLSLGERTEQLEESLKIEEENNRNEQESLESLKEELLKRKSRLQSLQELERNFEGYQDGPKSVLQKRRTGELDFDLTAVADILETKPEFETAVSAVLGERMQFVVVPDAAKGMQCAELLKVTGAGRGSFIPLSLGAGDDGLEVRDYDGLEGDGGLPGFRGRLADFVAIRPGFEKLKKILFGDVLLVDAVGNALETWQRTHRNVVTLEGEVISADGVLTGGSLENAAKALLEKKREIKELSGVVEELVAQVQAKSESCIDLKRKIQSLRGQIDEIKDSVHGENLRIATQEKDIAHLKHQIEAVNQRRGQISQTVFEATEALERLQAQLDGLTAEESEQRAKLDEALTVLNEKKSEEESCRREISSRQEGLARDKIALAQARQQRDFLAKESERLLDERGMLERELIRKEEMIRLLTKQRILLEDQVAFFENAIAQVLSLKVAAEELHRERRDAFEGSSASIREREVSLKQLRSEHEGVKTVLTQATLALTETRSQLSRLSDQIFERYQLLIAEAYRDYQTVPEGFDFAAEAERAREMRLRLAGMGSVNLAAIEEFEELKGRFEFLDAQRIDLETSLQALEDAIQKINRTTRDRFKETFELVNEKFSYLFPKLFRGGQAYLSLTDPENILETGVDIIAQPPGKKLQSITLLSGGEKALTAVSLLFAIFLIKPSPFCLLDEVDAPLDDVNVDRYNEIIKEMSQRTQFVVITHNKRTMQMTNCLFGVTMQDPGVSQLVSVNLD